MTALRCKVGDLCIITSESMSPPNNPAIGYTSVSTLGMIVTIVRADGWALPGEPEWVIDFPNDKLPPGRYWIAYDRELTPIRGEPEPESVERETTLETTA